MNQNPFPPSAITGLWACDGFTASAPTHRAAWGAAQASTLPESPAQDLKRVTATASLIPVGEQMLQEARNGEKLESSELTDL